jgi:hypothetical protein
MVVYIETIRLSSVTLPPLVAANMVESRALPKCLTDTRATFHLVGAGIGFVYALGRHDIRQLLPIIAGGYICESSNIIEAYAWILICFHSLLRTQQYTDNVKPGCQS